MYALEIACTPGESEALIAELWERGTFGVVEAGNGLIAYFAGESEARAAAMELSAHAPRVKHVPEGDWEESWRASWRPFEVGERFFLAPEWSADPGPPGRIRLLLRPGRACGTGLHPCSRLCLELLEQMLEPGCVVLDVGTGSGLLAAGAARLGAAQVIACDISEEATAEARERFRREATGVLLFQGSLRALKPATADLVLVNISAPAAIALAAEIRRVTKPAGTAVVSGFRLRSAQCVRDALATAGLTVIESRRQGDWQAMVCRLS